MHSPPFLEVALPQLVNWSSTSWLALQVNRTNARMHATYVPNACTLHMFLISYATNKDAQLLLNGLRMHCLVPESFKKLLFVGNHAAHQGTNHGTHATKKVLIRWSVLIGIQQYSLNLNCVLHQHPICVAYLSILVKRSGVSWWSSLLTQTFI